MHWSKSLFDEQRMCLEEPALLVMSTLTLDSLTSYIGTDANDQSTSFIAYKYTFAYKDTPFISTTSPISGNDIYAAGDHLLTSVTPTVYQSGTAMKRQPLVLQYTPSHLTNTYYDGDNDLSAKTKWYYLQQYQDLQTGIGESVTYQQAFNNTHGTPNDSAGDTRYDPFFCSTFTTCSGSYNHPDEFAWSDLVFVACSLSESRRKR